MIVYDNLSVGNAKKKKKDNAVESFKSGLYAGFNAAMNQQAGKASGSKLGEAYANIYKMKEKDPDRASKMSGVLSYLRSDPTSEYYNAYSQPTSNAFNQLKALGFDTNLINDDFFGSQDYQNFMAQNLERSDTTGGVKAPSKKSTIQNQLAYYLDKTYGDYQTTKKAKEEYNSMMDTAMYLAGNPAWNYSDQKILDEINKDFDKNYPTLSKMRNSGNTPVGLTEAMDFSEDAMLGAIWAGRNPEYSGTLEGAMANSYLGKGNVWKEDPKISAMLNPEDPSFLPYATGSTNLLKEGQILKRYYYPEEYFDSQEFKDAYYGDDPVKKAAAEKVLNAEGNQKAADKAVPAIIGYANYLLTNDHDANSVRGKIDTALAAGKLYVSTDANGNQKFYTKPGKGREEIDLGILNKIDKTVGKTDADGKRSYPVNDPEELLSFTRGVNYKYDNLIGQVNDICDQYSKQSSGDTYANLNPDNQGAAREKKPFELIEEAKSKRAADAMYILDDKLSEMERKNFGALPMPNGTKLAEAFYNVKRGLWGNGEEMTGPYDTEKLTNPEWVAKMATRQAEKAEKNFLDTGLSSLQVRTQYEANKKEAEKLQAQLDEIENQYGDIILAKQDIPELLNVVIDESTGFSVNLRLEKDKDGNSVYKYHQKDNEDFSLSLPAQEYMNRNNLTEQDVYAAINERAKRSDDNIKLVQDAKKRVFGAKQELTLDDGDGNELDIPFYYNEESGSFDLSPDFNSRDQSVFDFLNNSGYTENELWVEINEYINQLNAELEGPNEEEVNRITARLDQLKGQLSATQDEYDKAVKDYDRANSRRARVNDLTLRNSGLYVDPAITDKILSFVGGFTDSKLPEAGYDSLVDDLQSVFGLRELTDEESKSYKENVDELNAHAKDIRFMIDNYNLSDFYKEKMTKEAEYYESRGRLYNAYLITKEDDYESLIKEALDENNELSYDGIAKPYRSGINKTAWGQMTSTERGVYYALSVKEGLEAATQFYQDIEANLIARARTNIREGVKETAESGVLGRVFNEAASIGSALFEVPLNVAYLIDSAINGEGSKWWRIPSEAAQEAHQAVINELDTIYDGTIWKDIFTGGAEILNNRGRSYAIGGVFGKFMPHIPGEGKMIDAANDIISSFPIATIAFGEAYEDAMENDMEPWQAWTLGTVNFLCESVTEGIKFGNYKSLMDGNLTLDTFVDYFADKIAGLDWLEEATGETLNNILERAFNKWVGGDKSEEQKKIQEYIDSGLVSSVDEARAMVMADYIKEDMHTAIISALSSFLDVGMFGAAKLLDTAHYAKELMEARRNGDTTSTIRSLRNQDIQQIKMIRDFQEQAEKIRQNRIEEANKPFVPANPANVSESQMQRNQTEYDVDQTILENAADSDQESVTGTIAAVLRISVQNANRANAAAVSFTDRFGEDAVSALQSMLEAGRKAGTNINTLKLGIQYSMLAEGECRLVMESEAYQNASPEEQAQMLSMATQADANNQAVQATVQEAVHDNRVAEAEKDLFGENEAFELNALQENADEAARKTYIAQEEMNDRMEARKAAADNVTSVTMDFLADPSDANKKRKDQAERELAAADAVSKEYEQAFNKARENQTKAENALEQTKDDVMTRIRQQAEEQVSQLEQQEAIAEQKANEALAAAEEERVRLQAEEDVQTGKAQEDEDIAKIDEYIRKQGLQGERAEQLRQKAVQTYHDMKTGNMDTSRLLTDAEADMAIYYLRRRLGVEIEIDKKGDPNALPEGRDGRYANGKITLSHRLTVGQAMIQVALHEITHSLEKTKSYAKYKDTVFSILFSSPEQREAAIQQKLETYRLNGVKDFQREDAEREIVADFAMDDKTFANRQTIDRMLDAGLGGKIRNTLHNINQFLKNTKLEGEERVRAENLRKAERLYIKAMNERRNINTHPSSEQFSVNQFAQAAGLFYNEVNITDANGNVIAGPGLYTADPSVPENNAVKVEKVTPEMMANTPVGLLTNAAQALGTMNAETAGKIHTMFADLMTMCSNLQDTNLVWEIAGSTLYSEFSAIKGNSDKQYSTTVDFGTICTKTQAVINQLSRDMLRLGRGLTSQEILDVYNDVYQADLKVPCPVCYVFSRWLGVPSLLENIRQYQNRFLGEEGENLSKEEVQARVDAFIAKAHSEDFSIDEKFIEAQAKARQNALNKIDRIQNGRDGIAKTEAKIAKYRDDLAEKPNGNTRRYLASAEKKLAKLHEDLAQAKTDYDNSDIAAYAKVINKKKAELESKIKDKLIKIEGDDRGTRGINDDIRDAIKEGKPTDKLEEKRRSLYAEIDDLNVKLREVDAYNWVTQALCRLDENGRFVVDDAFKRTKNEVLLDLNRTGEFAKDVKNWTYRSTRGAGMGKAILPYSGAKIGDSVLGTGARTMANPYEDGDSEGAFNALKSSIMKAYRQNLIGGQRFQSTSDFRPEWGLDYIMTFIEQQAIGSKGQLYTKVNEAVPLYASVGIDTNCSIMPYANGWHDPAEGEIEAMSDTERKSRVVTFKGENGEERTVVLDFSDVTGMKYDAARLLSKSYDNVQMIMVGINDIHIRACLAGEEIDFVIPWHASGNTKSQLQNMMQTVNETLTNSSDYTKVQSDQIADKKALEAAHGKQERDEDLTAYERELIHKEQMRDARTRLLTGKTLTATDMERIAESEFLTGLYERFEGKTLDGKELPHNPDYWIELPGMEAERVKMTSSQAEQIFPYEYWDTTLTKDQADENGWRFVQYCQELGLVPRFSGGNQKDEKTGKVTRFGNFSGAVYDDNGNITGYDREQMAKGYWKTLIDRKMYDNNGNYRSQQQIDASKVRAGDLTQTEEGRIHTRSNIPDSISGANYRGEEAEAKYRKADQALKDRLAEKAANGDQKTREQAQIDLERINTWETAHANDHEQYRVTPEINPYEEMNAGEMMQLLRDAGVDYTASEEQWSINDNNSTEMTSAEMLQLLRDAGVYQQEEAPTDYEATGPQRQFGSETVQNAEAISQTVKNWLKMHSDYNPDTNVAQINRAVKWIMDKRSSIDPEGFWSALEDVENKNFNPLTADGQAKMYVLMSMASNKNDLNVQLRLADAINKQGTTLGQALQSRRLYRLMTPEGRLSILQKEVDRVNSELKRKGKEGNVTLSDWILRSAAAAQTEEEFAKARQAMWEELGSQLPVSWWDRFQAWRMVSMLGNPRTHIRNLVGNAMFVPAVTAKNKIGAALESIFVDEGERTKALRTDKAALEYAEADADRMQSKLTGEAKYSDANQIQRNKKPFGNSFLGKIAQGASDFSSDMLEKEDWIFLRYHYKNALAGWMTANKVTGEQLESDTELLDKARAYAIEEAQKATYRDANALAEWLGKGDKIPGVRLLTTSVLPFKKTPMNILKRGLEYSPLGFLKNISADVVRLAEYQKWSNGEKAEKADWALSPVQFIDKLSSGITGLGIAGIGAFMKSMGWLTLGFKKDEPEDEFRKARGEQEYALHINLFGQDITYTIDWSAPSCMPLFVGATIQEAVERSGNLDLGETLMGLGSVTEPIWNLSMLDGLNSLFETSQYEDGNVATQILMKVGLNYANSFIPTMVGQLSRTIDPARRKSYVQSGSKPSAAYYTFEQMQNKTPWSVYNIPYRDVRGNEDRRSWVQRLLENFISPGYLQSSEEDSTLNELERLYKDNTGNESVQPSELKKLVPQNADKSFTVKNETIRLTDQQYDKMDVERKQYAFDLMDKLIADPYYASVDDTARVDMINDVWTYATQQARYNQFPQVTREDWITRAQKNNIDMLDVIKKRSEDQIKQDSIDGWSNALVDSIKAGNQDDVDTAIGTLELHDLDEDDISKIVKNGFSKDYVKAYKDDDEDEMNAIESMLYDAGFEFDYESWLNTTIKNEEKWLEDYSTGNNSGRFPREAGRLASAGMSDTGGGRSTPMPKRPASDDDWGEYMDNLDDYWAGYDFSKNDPVGQRGQGNIDLNNRQIVQNDDGSISTERSFSFYDERTGKEVLIPLVVDGRVLTEEEAIDRYYETGEYLGMFDDWHDADEYAMMLHNRQDWFYNR